MNFGNCVRCGKTISYKNVRICEKCKEKELDRVKEYLNNNGVSLLDKISSDLNIPRKLLVEFIIDERLELTSINEDDVKKVFDDVREQQVMKDLSLFNSRHPKKELETKKIKEQPKMRFLNKK